MIKKILFFVICLVLATSQIFAADLLDLVPSDATLVIRSNVKQVIHIPEVKKAIQEALSKQNKSEFLKGIEETGFNPLNDIDSVVLFMPIEGVQGKDALKASIALIATGKFKVDVALNSIKNNKDVEGKVVVSEEDGFRTITGIDDEKGNTKILFIDDTTVIAGTEKGVNNAKLVKLGKAQSIKSKQDFSATITKLNANASLAAAIDLPDGVRQFFAGNELSKPLSSIMFLSFDLTKTNDVAINVIGDFNKSADMKEVEKSLNSFFSSVKPEELPYDVFTDFFKNHKLSVNGNSAIIATTVSKASVDKLIENFGSPERGQK